MSLDTFAVVLTNVLVTISSLIVVAATTKDSNRTLLDGLRLVLGKPPRHDASPRRPTTGESFDIHA